MPERLPEVRVAWRKRVVQVDGARGRRLADAVASSGATSKRRSAPTTRSSPRFAGITAGQWRRALEGKRVVAARRWGKQLWFELDAPPHPLFHFGMAGGFKAPASVPLQLKSGPREDASVWPPRFMKIRLRLDDGGELAMTDGRRLGRLLLREDPEHEPPVANLGFDPLLAMPSPERFSALVRARGGVVKSLKGLLDQSFSAGKRWATGSPTRRSSRPGSIPGGGHPRSRTPTRGGCAPGSAPLSGARSTPTRTTRAIPARGCSTAAGASAVTHARRAASRLSTCASTIGGRTTAWVPLRQG